MMANTMRKGALLTWRLCLQASGIYRFEPEWLQILEGDPEAALPFQRLAGARVASLRCPILRPGTDQYTSADFTLEKAFAAERRAGYK